MKLLSKAIAEKIFEELTADGKPVSRDIIKDIADEKNRLLKTAISTIVFLFTTLIIISIAVFEREDQELSFFGLNINNKDIFVFTGFMVGNALYVVCTGMFIKLFICEFLIANIVRHYDVEDGKKLQAFLRIFHANTISFVLEFNLIPENNKILRFYLILVNVYAKYMMVVIYGIYYYTILLYFLRDLYYREESIIFITLISANIFSIITSFAVFIIVDENSNIGLKFSSIEKIKESILNKKKIKTNK